MLEWQQESFITNGNPDLFENFGDFDTDFLTGVKILQLELPRTIRLVQISKRLSSVNTFLG